MEALRDRALTEAVQQHLMSDQRLAGQALIVTSNFGYVQVCGVVDSDEKRLLAMEVARGVSGVHEVTDCMEIRKPVLESVDDR